MINEFIQVFLWGVLGIFAILQPPESSPTWVFVVRGIILGVWLSITYGMFI